MKMRQAGKWSGFHPIICCVTEKQLFLNLETPESSRTEIPGVTVKVAPRLRRSWRLERHVGRAVLVIPAALETAPAEVQQALSSWTGTVLRPAPGTRAKRQAVERIIFGWLGEKQPLRVPPEAPAGRFCDLRPLFDELNATYFGGRLEAVLRWTPRAGTTSFHQRIGDRDVITVSRRFDGRDVPREAILGVLSHEMLHIALPPKTGGKRRVVHHRAFREAERAFPFYEVWRAWELAQAAERSHGHLLPRKVAAFLRRFGRK